MLCRNWNWGDKIASPVRRFSLFSMRRLRKLILAKQNWPLENIQPTTEIENQDKKENINILTSKIWDGNW